MLIDLWLNWRGPTIYNLRRSRMSLERTRNESHKFRCFWWSFFLCDQFWEVKKSKAIRECFYLLLARLSWDSLSFIRDRLREFNLWSLHVALGSSVSCCWVLQSLFEVVKRNFNDRYAAVKKWIEAPSTRNIDEKLCRLQFSEIDAAHVNGRWVMRIVGWIPNKLITHSVAMMFSLVEWQTRLHLTFWHDEIYLLNWSQMMSHTTKQSETHAHDSASLIEYQTNLSKNYVRGWNSSCFGLRTRQNRQTRLNMTNINSNFSIFFVMLFHVFDSCWWVWWVLCDKPAGIRTWNNWKAHTWCTQIAFCKIWIHQIVTNCDMQREGLSLETDNSSE